MAFSFINIQVEKRFVFPFMEYGKELSLRSEWLTTLVYTTNTGAHRSYEVRRVFVSVSTGTSRIIAILLPAGNTRTPERVPWRLSLPAYHRAVSDK